MPRRSKATFLVEVRLTRPSGVLTPATPNGDPFGLYGYASVGLHRLSVYRNGTSPASSIVCAWSAGSPFLRAKDTRPSPWAVTIGSVLLFMPCRNTEGGRLLDRVGDRGESEMETMQTRASYCSLTFGLKLGQVEALHQDMSVKSFFSIRGDVWIGIQHVLTGVSKRKCTCFKSTFKPSWRLSTYPGMIWRRWERNWHLSLGQ